MNISNFEFWEQDRLEEFLNMTESEYIRLDNEMFWRNLTNSTYNYWKHIGLFYSSLHAQPKLKLGMKKISKQEVVQDDVLWYVFFFDKKDKDDLSVIQKTQSYIGYHLYGWIKGGDFKNRVIIE